MRVLPIRASGEVIMARNRDVTDELDKLLDSARLSRAELARRLGLSPGSVSRWRGKPPAYAAAYLRLLGLVRVAAR